MSSAAKVSNSVLLEHAVFEVHCTQPRRKPLCRALRTSTPRDLERDRAVQASAYRRLEALSPRECQVLHQVVAGRLSKQIAHEFRITEKTVKVHRHRIMAKLGMRNVIELVRFAVWAGLAPNVWPLPSEPPHVGPVNRDRLSDIGQAQTAS